MSKSRERQHCRGSAGIVESSGCPWDDESKNNQCNFYRKLVKLSVHTRLCVRDLLPRFTRSFKLRFEVQHVSIFLVQPVGCKLSNLPTPAAGNFGPGRARMDSLLYC